MNAFNFHNNPRGWDNSYLSSTSDREMEEATYCKELVGNRVLYETDEYCQVCKVYAGVERIGHKAA